MSLKTFYFKRQKGVADLFTLTLLAAGLILGVFLVGQRTNLFPRAQTPVEPPISIPSPTSDIKKDLPAKSPEDLSEKKDKGVVCIQVITPARNTKTGECREFSTPCDIPDGWEEVSSCPSQKDSPSEPVRSTEEKDKGVECIQVITPAKNTTTGECREFSTPCDIPSGWKEVSSCPTPPPISISTLESVSQKACTLGDFKDSLWAKKGESKYNPVCDANNDGKISIFDYSAILKR